MVENGTSHSASAVYSNVSNDMDTNRFLGLPKWFVAKWKQNEI